jgi:hypothetical protein
VFTVHRIISECESGGYMYAHTFPLHPKANSKGLYPSHRIIVETSLGRYLDKSENVHHRNGNKKDNTLANLEVLTVNEHIRLHGIDRQVENVRCICDHCGKNFEIPPATYRLRVRRNKLGKLFCSLSCGTKYQIKTKQG